MYEVLSDLEASSSNMPSNDYWIYHPDEKKYIRPNQTFFKKAQEGDLNNDPVNYEGEKEVKKE